MFICGVTLVAKLCSCCGGGVIVVRLSVLQVRFFVVAAAPTNIYRHNSVPLLMTYLNTFKSGVALRYLLNFSTSALTTRITKHAFVE